MKYFTIKSLLLSIAAVGLLGLTACDQTVNKQPAQSIEPNQVFEDAQGVQNALNGVYDGLQQPGTFGGASILFADIGADITDFGGSFEEFNSAEAFSININNGFVTDIWFDSYITINRANIVIENTSTDIEGLNQADVDRIVGQAKFLRAAMYWNLVRWFGEPYDPSASSNDQLGVPLRTSAVQDVESASETPSRASVEAVYTQIQNDLSDARSKLSVNPTRTRAGVQAARALQAEVALYQGRYDDAAAKADTVISDGNYTLPDDPTDPFQNESSSEIVFSVSFSPIDNPGINDFPAAFYLPSERGGRGDANPYQGFIDDATDGDIRAGIGDVDGDSLLYDFVGSIWTNKWSGTQLGDDYTWLRLGKTKLTRAEALVRGSGSATDARAIVNEIRNRAGLSDVSSSLSGQDLIDEIIRQRRYELAFEGDRRHTQDRLGLTIVNASTPPGGVGPDADQRLLPIPRVVLERNDNLTQNPGY